MTLHVHDIVQVAPAVKRHKGRIGTVATIVRVNPRTKLVTVGERPVTRQVGGKSYEGTTPITEEQALDPVYEVGVDFTDPQQEGVLRTDLWFRPEELVATGKKSVRVTAKQAKELGL